MFQKDLKISELIDIYGPLLSDRRREIIEAYYYDDLSLSEIAENMNMTRQGARDSIKKSEIQLSNIEEKLHLAALFKSIDEKTGRIASAIEGIGSSLPESEAIKLSVIAEELRSIRL